MAYELERPEAVTRRRGHRLAGESAVVGPSLPLDATARYHGAVTEQAHTLHDDSPAIAQAQTEVAETYRRREHKHRRCETRWARRSRWISYSRLTVFLAILICGGVALARASERPVGWLVAAGALVALFVCLLLLHERVIGQERRFGQLAALDRQGIARLGREFGKLPLPPEPLSEEEREVPLGRDLHLFGRASLFHLLASSGLSPPGRTILASWLLEPASPETVRRRQEAVAELAGAVEFRQELAYRAAGLAEEDAAVEPFLRWAEEDPWLLARRGRLLLSILLPALLVAATAAALVGAFPPVGLLLLLWLHILVSHFLGGEIHGIFDRVSERESRFHHYASLFQLLDGQSFASPHLQSLVAELETAGLSAHRQMEILHQRVVLSDSRHSGPLSFVLEGLFLWSFHVLHLLERWQRTAGPRVRRWLHVLGEVEALAALAALDHDHPGWEYPELAEGDEARLVAGGLAHPLIPPGRAVANDIEVGPPGSFLLVTGSNMSGKSTLLRALGINVVLAQTGAPVCAGRLSMPPLTLGTSILIEDSLEDGISFFMAELLRLQEIVEAARQARREGHPLLYLLDEMLRGTNSRERRLAARSILRHLIEEGAIGAVSTHDPALLEAEDLASAAHPVHFRETVHARPDAGQVMTFDYRLREGVATGGNAMKLLELVGLGGAGEELREAGGDGSSP